MATELIDIERVKWFTSTGISSERYLVDVIQGERISNRMCPIAEQCSMAHKLGAIFWVVCETGHFSRVVLDIEQLLGIFALGINDVFVASGR